MDVKGPEGWGATIHESMYSQDPEVRREARERATVDHLRAIRGYLQFLAWVTAIGIVLGILGAFAASAQSSSGY